MFTGKRATFTQGADDHTMVVNIDRKAGAFTCVVWDGFQADYHKGVQKALVGTFSRGRKRIQVLVYGGTLPRATIIALLSAFVGGKWVKMTLNDLAGGETIPKHRL
jgi:hypothetical protein